VYPDKRCTVGFGGHTEAYRDSFGRYRVRWVPSEHALGIPHDVPMAGYRVNTCARLRLWRAVASESFDLAAFNSGDFYGAVEEKVSSENLSKVLYPNDGTDAGRRLRLKQQFFFVSCSLQDMLRNLLKKQIPLQQFPEHWAVQLNDTHPAIAVAELMRLLVDEHMLGWEGAEAPGDHLRDQPAIPSAGATGSARR
jgi:starch phosphorylase